MVFLRSFPRSLRPRRTWCAWALLLLLIPLNCWRKGDPQAEYDHAWQLFQHGYLEQGQNEAKWGYRRYSFLNPEWASKFQLLEAESMVWRGMDEEALRVFASQLSLPSDPGQAIRRLTIEGVALIRLERFAEAEQRIESAERICATIDSPFCGGAIRARGVMAMERAQLPEAQKSFLKSLAFARTHKDQWLEATALLNLGFAALQSERYDEAIDWSSAAYKAAADLGGEDLAQSARGNLGWAYFKLGDADTALELLLDAEKRAAALGNILVENRWQTSAGHVYQESGDLQSAANSFRQAVDSARQIDSKEDVVNSLEELAHASIEAGSLEDANSYLSQLSQLVSTNGNHLDTLVVTLAQGKLAAALRNDRKAEAIFRSVEQDKDAQISMRIDAEHELARLYESEGRASDADAMYKTALATFESERDQIQNEDSKLPFLTNATPIYDDYIHFLVKQDKSVDALAVADQSRALTLAQGLGVPRGKASPPLHPTVVAGKAGATLLFYWLGARQSYLWAVSAKKIGIFLLPPQREIKSRIDRYRKALLGPEDPLDAAYDDGTVLYKMLVAPAAGFLQTNSSVVILADGPLSQLNFETLIVPGDAPHFWIEDATLISAPSLHMLAAAKPARSSGRNLLMLGDAVPPNAEYPQLPKAGLEMRQIQKHYGALDQTIFTGEKATPAAYLASAPGRYSYIHFVTHGVASRSDPLDSAIILSRTNSAEDSFKLHAREIIKHPIDAQLVTVSACYGSGSKSYAGEGLVGLSWAFLRAGAHNVIGALWEVSDESTPRLMDTLYQGLEDGQSPASALRRAKLALLHSKSKFRKPFFWASFQIYTGR